jgi:hypothetical protein
LPPFSGNHFFVDAVSGSDGNEGDAENPFATLAYAYSKTTSGNNDVIYIVGDGATTGTQRLTATLTWANNATHLIGLTAPVMYASRARISHSTTATAAINPLVSVTGSGCIFANFSLFQGIAATTTADQLWKDSGERNYYYRVHFGGMGKAASGAGSNHASSYCLYLHGGGERLFEQCVVGLDTISRGAANASLLLDSEAARDVFKECHFPMYAGATTPVFVDCNSSASLNRKITFYGCQFLNIADVSGYTVAAVVKNNAAQNGYVVIEDCSVYGATHWTAAAASLVLIASPTHASMGTTGGFAVTATIT